MAEEAGNLEERKPDLHLSKAQIEQANELSKNDDDVDAPLAHENAPHSLQRRPSTPNAASAPVRQADVEYTGGRVNVHPAASSSSTNISSFAGASSDAATAFRVGVSEDRNKKCRRTMEDSHAFVYDFAGVKGQGYFAVFDGHAGKHAAEWCGQNFHKYLLQQLTEKDKSATSSQEADAPPIPDLLNQTFHIVDAELSKLSAKGGTHSGCTAVTAFLRLEDSKGNAVQLEDASDTSKNDAPTSTSEGEQEGSKRKFGDGVHRERLKSFLGSSSNSAQDTPAPASEETAQIPKDTNPPRAAKNFAKRTLYTANVGDARAVLSRGGKAVRLTYDHKGSDIQEAQRIKDAGGFVLNSRVNGVLAVTRALGDSQMKEFVVGSPYTTETTIGKEDKFLVIACDGLWDVCEDQQAIDLIKDLVDPQEASKVLLDHALQNFSTDNLSVLVVQLAE